MKFSFPGNLTPPAALPLLLVFLCGTALAEENPEVMLPPPAEEQIDFDRDIRPILEASCLRCHGSQKPKSYFSLASRTTALAGGDENENDIVPGDSAGSLLIHYVAHQVPDMEMPPPDRGDPLPPRQISLLRAWIDQGANWSTTNQPSTLNSSIAPTLRWISVQGNEGKFRELEDIPTGLSGGVERFLFMKQTGPETTLSLDGRGMAPEQDFGLKLALDRTDRGFVHAGFDQWRKYYSDAGGFDPSVFPPGFNSDRDLHVDHGRAWIDFGLDLPRWPRIVLGYEYQYRNGTKSTLDWGYANGKNIYPATRALEEQTHLIKLDVARRVNEWTLEDHAQVEFHSAHNSGNEEGILFGGTTPDESITTRDDYRQVQGMNILRVEKQVRDWWLLNGGIYYSRLSGDAGFNQTIAIPSLNFNNLLSSQHITLSRESEVFSLASLFTPLKHLSVSVGTQNAWTRERGFSPSIPDLELGGNVPANATLNEFKASQSTGLRFTRIPSTVVFGDMRFSEDSCVLSQAEAPDEFHNETAANNFRYELKPGFTTSPWPWLELTLQYDRRSSATDYHALTDVWQGIGGPTNGYPAFIFNRTIRTDEFESKLVLRPVQWFRTTLSYQLASTDYGSTTDPAYDSNLMQSVSDGGLVADGHYDLQTCSIGITLTPARRWYFSGTFTYSQSRAVTAVNGDPSIGPYEGDIYTLTATATCVLDAKTSLRFSYGFSQAGYAQNNAATGIPVGLEYTRNKLVAGVKRQLTEHLTGVLQYQFSQYKEPSVGNVNDFTADGVFLTLSYHWQ